MAINSSNGERRPNPGRKGAVSPRTATSANNAGRVKRSDERVPQRRPASRSGDRYPDYNRERRDGSRYDDMEDMPVRRRRAPEGTERVRERSPESSRSVGAQRRPSSGQGRPASSQGRPSSSHSRQDSVQSRTAVPQGRPGSGSHSGGQHGSGKSRKKKSKKTMILFFMEIVIIVMLLGFIYFVRQTSRVEKIRINEEAITIEMNQNVSTNETMKGYRNIAMFGVDSREGTLGKGTRSDTIIIASINQDTGDVKLLSVFRDTYLNLGNDSYNKCNAAYAQGGPEQAVIMLNKNLDMDITDYITVGFDGLIEVIDALGGVEINVTEAEIPHLNNYQISMVGTTKDGINFTANAGTDYTPVTSAGMQTLNGLQATAYCRIRYIGNDFQRAQRQRDVITAITVKAKKASVAQLNGVVNGVMDNISTSLDINEILEVAADVAKYNVVGSDGFPFEENRDTGRVGGKGDCVIPVDLKTNVVSLHEFLFNEKDYVVSPEIETYSDKVASDTGKRK